MPLRVPPALAVVLATVLLTGCTSNGQPSGPAASEPVPAAPASAPRYVALGDSYTAAPFVPQTDVAGGCFRSDGNYPALVAAELGADLVDVSCSGAETKDVRAPQIEGVAPQARALTRDTALVTVSLGGNDGGLFETLVARCRPTGETCPDALSPALREELQGVLATTSRDLAATLRLVQRRAPQARVLVVGYPTIVSDERACDLLPLTDSDRAAAAELNRGLNTAVREAAERVGATYVDVASPSADHDVCAEDPWVNGILTDQTRALAFHPFVEGQQAVADLVVDAAR